MEHSDAHHRAMKRRRLDDANVEQYMYMGQTAGYVPAPTHYFMALEAWYSYSSQSTWQSNSSGSTPYTHSLMQHPATTGYSVPFNSYEPSRGQEPQALGIPHTTIVHQSWPWSSSISANSMPLQAPATLFTPWNISQAPSYTQMLPPQSCTPTSSFTPSSLHQVPTQLTPAQYFTPDQAPGVELIDSSQASALSLQCLHASSDASSHSSEIAIQHQKTSIISQGNSACNLMACFGMVS
jgi:hypothetical protein